MEEHLHVITNVAPQEANTILTNVFEWFDHRCMLSNWSRSSSANHVPKSCSDVVLAYNHPDFAVLVLADAKILLHLCVERCFLNCSIQMLVDPPMMLVDPPGMLVDPSKHPNHHHLWPKVPTFSPETKFPICPNNLSLLPPGKPTTDAFPSGAHVYV